MKNDVLGKAVLFELNKANYSESERKEIKRQLLRECKSILQKTNTVFVQTMDNITNL